MKKTLIAPAFFALVLSGWFISGCKDNPASHTENVTVTADTSIVTKLAITTRPITDSTARLIAEAASTGKTITSALATKDGISYYDVQVLVGTLTIDVKVRVSDGAVITISDADSDGRR